MMCNSQLETMSNEGENYAAVQNRGLWHLFSSLKVPSSFVLWNCFLCHVFVLAPRLSKTLPKAQRPRGPLGKGSSQQSTHINKLQRSWLSALAKQVAACDLITKSFRQAIVKLLAASNLLSTLSSTLISATAITSSFEWWIKSQKQELVTDKARQSSDSGPKKHGQANGKVCHSVIIF